MTLRPSVLALLVALALLAVAVAHGAEQAPLVPLVAPVPCPLNLTAVAAAFENAARAADTDADEQLSAEDVCRNGCRAVRARCRTVCPTGAFSEDAARCARRCKRDALLCARDCSTVQADELPPEHLRTPPPSVAPVVPLPLVAPCNTTGVAAAAAAAAAGAQAAALAAAAGLANPEEKRSLSSCESACVGAALKCVTPCPRDVWSEEGPRCRRRCRKTKLTCVRDCNTVEADVVDSALERRLRRRGWHQRAVEALAPTAPLVAAAPPAVPAVAAAADPKPVAVAEKTAAQVIAPAVTDPSQPQPLDENTAAVVVAPAVTEPTKPMAVDEATAAAVVAPAVADPTKPVAVDEATAAAVVSPAVSEPTPVDAATQAAVVSPAVAAEAQPAGATEHASLKKDEAEAAAANSNAVPPSEMLETQKMSELDLLPLVAASVSAVPASVRESSPFNLNAGGGVWRRGEPAAPQRSPVFSVSTKPRTMTVAQLPLQAKLCMLLTEVSYQVKAVSMSDMFAGATSKNEWVRLLGSLALEFHGSELYPRLSQMVVVSSSWDSALLAYKEVNGHYTLYVGGHGSVANSADWLGQNVGLSRVSEFVGSSVNWFSNFVLGKKVVDLPRQRSTRWVEAVDAAMQTSQFNGKVSQLQVFGHSMSGYQGHLAADTLLAKYPRVPLEAWLLNPGGSPPLSGKPTPHTQIHHLVTPGEALETLGIGGGDPRKISLQLNNINAAKYSNVVNRAVYLHGLNLVTDDIRALAGVGAFVELCTRKASVGTRTDCYLRALDKTSAFAYSKENGVYWISNGSLLPSLQCTVVPGVTMGSLRNRASADTSSKEWSKASYHEASHNSCHWANHALVMDGAYGVERWVDGSLPEFKKAA